MISIQGYSDQGVNELGQAYGEDGLLLSHNGAIVPPISTQGQGQGQSQSQPQTHSEAPASSPAASPWAAGFGGGVAQPDYSAHEAPQTATAFGESAYAIDVAAPPPTPAVAPRLSEVVAAVVAAATAPAPPPSTPVSQVAAAVAELVATVGAASPPAPTFVIGGGLVSVGPGTTQPITTASPTPTFVIGGGLVSPVPTSNAVVGPVTTRPISTASPTPTFVIGGGLVSPAPTSNAAVGPVTTRPISTASPTSTSVIGGGLVSTPSTAATSIVPPWQPAAPAEPTTPMASPVASPRAPSAQAPTAPTLPADARFEDTAPVAADTAAAVVPRSASDVDGYLPKAVALVSGNDLGLTGSSLDRLGTDGTLGQTARTTSGESLYVNTRTGNLVVQRTDELLVGLGPDAQVLRTYNSQALLDGDNNDNWRIGFYRQVSSLTGTVNTTGSSLVRVEADGSQRTYTFNGTHYVNADGTGAHDTLSYNAANGTWTWTDGDSRVRETYAAFTNGSVGRLLSTEDIDGNTIAYAYNSAGLLTKVTTANTGGLQTNQTELVYDSTPGRTANLLELQTTAWNAETLSNQVLTRTRYSYDGTNRLERVTTDLSPEDNSVTATGSSNPNDGKTYSTTYTYDGDSKRIASITESNRARVSFVYDSQGRVTQFTEGGGRTTHLSYSTAPTAASTAAPGNTATDTTGYTVKAEDLAAANPWAAITLTLFGAAAASDATAVANLRAALGNPVLSAGLVLTPPASLSYSSSQTVTAGLVTQSIVTPTAEWKPITGLESSSVAAYAPQVAFAANGDALSVWTQGADLLATTYSKASGTWSPPIAIDGGNADDTLLPHLSSSANGNMLVTWKQGNSIYARRYVGGAWDSGPTLLSNGLVGGAYYSTGAISDSGKATVVFAGSDGYRWNAVANTFNGSTWLASPVQVDDVGGANNNSVASDKYPRVAMDAAGNATMTWVQAANGETAASLFVSRYVVGAGASTGVWSTPSSTLLENSAVDVKNFQVAFDKQGNGLAAWIQGTTLYTKSFNAASQQWGVVYGQASAATGEISLSMSGNGNAILAIVSGSPGGSDGTIYARRYADGIWLQDGFDLLSNGVLATARAPNASINDQGQAVVTFMETDSSGERIFAQRLQGGVWSGITQVEAAGGINRKPVATIDATGNVQVVWSQQTAEATAQGGTPSMYARRFENAGEPFYPIPAGATWASVAQTLYGSGSDATVSALRQALSLPDSAALPAAGTHLQGLPSSLNVTQTLTQQATLNSQAIGATAVAPAPVIPSSTFANLPEGATSVVITDPLGQQTQVINDAKGRLIEVRGPQLDGASQITRYQYDDATGQLRSRTDARGLTTTYEYDAQGNQALVRDATGNTTTRTYGALNQLLTQTRYAVADPDGPGAAQASGAETTRYVYNSQNKLRYAISAEGQVSEYRWGTSGNERGQQVASLQYTKDLFTTEGAVTEAVVDAWLNGGQVDKTSATRVDSRYDFRGQLASSTRYERLDANGNGVADASASSTHYVYDAAGQLLKSIESGGGPVTSGVPTGTVTQYAYDGLSRIYRVTDSLGVATLTQFDDALNRVTTTLANGLSTTRSYNQIGEMTGSVQAAASNLGSPLSTTAQFFDAAGRQRQSQDALGYSSYAVYDAAGRQVGSVEADGTLVETRYNATHQAVQTIRYANAVSNAQLAALQADVAARTNTVTLAQLRPSADSTRDRVTFSLYDDAGRLAKTVDELGFVSEMRYDGASRVSSSVRYATALTAQQKADLAQNILTASPTAAYASVAVNVSEDRASRNFYDRDGRLQASLDAAGVLSENFYDGAGRLVHTVTYATPAASTLWATGTLAQLRPQNGAANQAQDSHSWLFYDAKSQRVAELNAEGFLTEHRYDERGNKLQSTRYANVALIAPAQVSTRTTLAQLRPAPSTVGAGQDQTTSWTYTALNQVRSQVDAQGTVTQFTYNNVGQLIQTDKALGTTEQRSLQSRYDLQGRVVAELTAEGSAALAAHNAAAQSLSATNGGDAAVEAIWQQYGLTHSYDAAGRRTSTTDQNGAITRFFYNSDSQLVFTVNDLGEVKENRYDALGELTHSIEYASRLNIAALAAASPQTWKGGNAHNANVRTAVMGLVNASLDSVRRYSYDQRGQLAASLDALSNYSTNRYNAFGQQVEQTQNIDSTRTTTTRSSYDQRGLQRSTTVDAGGLNITTQARHDAFGRVIEQSDALGKRSSFEYDRLGRVVQSTDRGNVARSTTYDAFDRVLTQVDGNGHTTRYHYNDQARSLTVTTAEGIQTVSTQNRHGQTITMQDGRGNTTSYQYDKNGQLLSQTQDQLGITTQNAFDRAGRLIETTDARGIKTRLEFDSVGRVLTRTVDPTGLALVTRYTYDAKGNQVSMLDASGVLSQTEVDRKGQTVRITQDVGGLNLQTQYTYDAQGRTLVATDANGVQTHYSYDNAGRRFQEVLDPSAQSYVGLNLTRRFEYDAVGNMVRSIDANGNASVYAYDDKQQLVYTVDALGNTQKQDYDAEGRVVKVTQYANAINTAGLGSVFSWGGGETPVSRITSRITASGNDVVQHRVYDQDGRMTASIQVVENGQKGEVTRLVLDANGNVQERRAYASRLDMAAWTPGTPPLPVADDSRDARVSTVFDAANRATHQIDATGAVIKQVFDANGNVVDRIAYAKTVAPNTILHAAYIDAATAAIADSTKDARSQQVFDAAGRLQWRMDGVGAVTQMAYDKVGNLTKTVQYATAYSASLQQNTSLAQLVYSGVIGNSGTDSLDRATDFVYDNARRRIFSVDALGQVQQFRYDANGNMTQQVAYNRTVTAPSTIVGWSYGGGSISQYRQSDLESQLGADPTADTSNRISRYAFDAANRQVFMVDAQNAVTEQRFDGRGAVIQTLQHATSINTGGLIATASEQDIRNRLAADTAGQNRVQTNSYDAAGRLQVSVDGEGFATSHQMDALGRITATTRLAEKATVDAQGKVTLASSSATHSNNRTDRFEYDQAGRLKSSTDALQKREAFTYDGLGNKTSFTNKNGATWTYQYDAGGRLTQETSPQVQLTSVMNLQGHLKEAATQLEAVVTQFSYDALGNLTQRREAVGRPGLEPRTTWYVYDAVGRQTQTILPFTGVYQPALDFLDTNGLAARADRAPAQALYTETFYDTFGDAVAHRDTAGQFSYKTYDKLGRLAFDIDALGYLTQHQRNAFGDETALTRFANASSLGGSNSGAPKTQSTSQVSATANSLKSVEDRTLKSEYNHRGQVVRVIEPETFVYDSGSDTRTNTYAIASKVTVNSYNAFGEVAQINTTSGVGNTTVTQSLYYNQRGQQVASVDAMGYLSTQQFDAVGNLTERKEYATEIEGWSSSTPYSAIAPQQLALSGDDRTTRFEYDLANRKTREIQVGAYRQSYDDGIKTIQPIGNNPGDRVRILSKASGDGSAAANSAAAAKTQFEAAGNLTTEFSYDAVGNLTKAVDAKGGITYTFYDALGRTLAVAAPKAVLNSATDEQATPLVTFKRDAFGNVVSQTEFAQGANDLGNKTELEIDLLQKDLRQGSSASRLAKDAGDMANRRTLTWYNAQGQAIQSSDAAGINRFVSYNAQGKVAKEWQAVSSNEGGTQPTVRTSFRVYQYDALGRVTSTIEPGANLGTLASNFVLTKQSYNAFGEVVTRGKNNEGQNAERDPISGLWDMGNASANRKAGQQEWFRYDNAGRLVATNAEDGQVKAYLYNAQGQRTAQIQSAGVGRGNINLEGYFDLNLDLNDASKTGIQAIAELRDVRRTEYVLDALGRVIEERLPQRVVSGEEVALASNAPATSVVPAPFSGSPTPTPAPAPGFVIGGTPATPAPAPSGGAVFGPGPAPSPVLVFGPTSPTPAPSGGAVFGPGPATPAPAPSGGAVFGPGPAPSPVLVFGPTSPTPAPSGGAVFGPGPAASPASANAGSVSAAAALAIMGYTPAPAPAPVPVDAALEASIAQAEQQVNATATAYSMAFTTRHSASSASNYAQHSLQVWNQMRQEHLEAHGSLDASTGWSDSSYQGIVNEVTRTAADYIAADQAFQQAMAATQAAQASLNTLLAAKNAATAPAVNFVVGGGAAFGGTPVTPAPAPSGRLVFGPSPATDRSATGSGSTTEKSGGAYSVSGGHTIKTGAPIGRSMDAILVLPPRQRPQEQWDSIKAIWRSHQGEPQVIIQWMTNYGVDASDLAFGSRQTLRQVGDYLLANGAGDGFAGWTASNGYQGSGIVATSGVKHTTEQIGNLLRTLDWGIPEWDTVSTAQMYGWAKEFGWTLQDIASGFGFFTAQQIREHFAKYGYTLIAVPRELSPGQRHTVAEISDYLRSMDWGIPAWDTASTAQAFEWAERYGWTLQEIGDALGFTAQQMREHFAKYNYTLSSDSLTNRIKPLDGPAQGPSTISTPPAPDASSARLAAPKVQRQYDRWGNVILITDPRGAQYQTTFKYNQNNQVVVQAVADLDKGDKAITQVHYDKLGKEVATTDANGNVEAKIYSSTGQLLEELHADGAVTRHAYNTFGNKVSATDGKGNTTQYGVDQLGRVTTVVHAQVDVNEATPSPDQTKPSEPRLNGVNPLGQRYTVDTQVWDEMGNLVQQTQGLTVTNPNAVIHTVERAAQKLAYDSQVSFDSSPQPKPVLSDTQRELIKALAGHPESALGQALAQGLKSVDISEGGRLDALVNSVISSAFNMVSMGADTRQLRTTQMAYDLRGNLLDTIRPDGSYGQRSRYNNQDQKVWEADANAVVNFNIKPSEWTVDYFGQMLSRTDQGGAKFVYTYDNARQLVEQKESNWNENKASYQVKDSDGKVLKDAKGNPVLAISDGVHITYTYDAAGQLVRIKDTGVEKSKNKTTLYDYNLAGQRTLELTTENGVAYQGNQNKYDYMGRLIQVDSVNSFRVGSSAGLDMGENWQNQDVLFDTKTYQLFNPDIYAAWKQDNRGMQLEEFAAWHRGMYGAGEPSRITGAATAVPGYELGQRAHNIAYAWTLLSELRTDKPYPTGPMAMAAYLQRNRVTLGELASAIGITRSGQVPSREWIKDYFENQYKNHPANGQANSIADYDYDIEYAAVAAPERLETSQERKDSLKLLMQANLLRPQTLSRIMLEFRVRPEELAQANGISLATLQLYFRNHGLNASQYDFAQRAEVFNPDVSQRVQDQIVDLFTKGDVQGLAKLMVNLRLTTQDIALAAAPQREILPSLVDLLFRNNHIGRNQYDISYRAIPDQFLLDLDQAVDAGGILGRSLGADNSIRSVTQRHLDASGFASTQEANPGELGNQPRAIASVMLQYGITAAELATAHGVDVGVVRKYFERFGIAAINYDPASLPSSLNAASTSQSNALSGQGPELTAGMARRFMADATTTAAGPSLIPPVQTRDQRLQAIATTWLRIATPRQDAATGPRAMAAYVVKNHVTLEELRQAVEIAQGTGTGSVTPSAITGYFESNGWGIAVPKSEYDVGAINQARTDQIAAANTHYVQLLLGAGYGADGSYNDNSGALPERPDLSARDTQVYDLLVDTIDKKKHSTRDLAALMLQHRISLQDLVTASSWPPAKYTKSIPINKDEVSGIRPAPFGSGLTLDSLKKMFADVGLDPSQYDYTQRADAFDWPELARAAKIQHDIYNFLVNGKGVGSNTANVPGLAQYMLDMRLTTQDVALAAAPMREINASLVDELMRNNGIPKEQYDIRYAIPQGLPNAAVGAGGRPYAATPDGKHPTTTVKMQYDGVGNRTSITTQVNHTDNPSINNAQEQHFVFDAMNRQVGVNLSGDAAKRLRENLADLRSRGILEAPTSAMLAGVSLDDDSHVLTYDAAGNRDSDTYLGRKLVGDPQRLPVQIQANQAVTERYAFDAQNRLKEVTRDDIKRDNSSGLSKLVADRVRAAGGAWTDPFILERRRYDALGQVLEVGAGDVIAASTLRTIYGEAPGNTGNAMPSIGDDRILYQYDKLGRVLLQSTWGSDGNFSSTVSYDSNHYSASGSFVGPSDNNHKNGYDAAGNLLQYTVFPHGNQTNSTYRTSYVYRDRALATTTTGWRTDDRGRTQSSSTLKTYDGNGHIQSVIDPANKNSDQTRIFNTDANGTVLRSVQIGRDSQGRLVDTITSTAASTVTQATGVQAQPNLTNEQFQLVAAGQVLGRYGEMVNPDGARDKDGNLQFIADSDFNFVFKSVNDGAAQGTSTYTVAKGDTLQSIAKAQLGDADLWFTIAQANGLADSAGLEEGQVLRIPAVVVTSTNNDDGTFEAYDPTAVIGDTTPVIPQPPKKKKNPLTMILIIVAAAVITIFTAGAAAVALGAVTGATSTFAAGLTVLSAGAIGGGAIAGAGIAAFAAAAVGGAVGSIASQGLNIAAGMQDQFSWKQVGVSALGAGIGSTGFVGTISSNYGAIAGAVVSNVATQTIAKAVGLQDSFSWRQVAASAVGAGVSDAVGGALKSSGAFGGLGSAFATGLARGTVSNFAGGLARSAVIAKGGKIDVGMIAADAFGNALGNSIVGQISQASQQAQRAQAIASRVNVSQFESNDPLGELIARNPQWAQDGGWRAPELMGPPYYPQPGDSDFMGPMPAVNQGPALLGTRTITLGKNPKGLLGDLGDNGFTTQSQKMAVAGWLKTSGQWTPGKPVSGQVTLDLDYLAAAPDVFEDIGRRGVSGEGRQRDRAADEAARSKLLELTRPGDAVDFFGNMNRDQTKNFIQGIKDGYWKSMRPADSPSPLRVQDQEIFDRMLNSKTMNPELKTFYLYAEQRVVQDPRVSRATYDQVAEAKQVAADNYKILTTPNDGRPFAGDSTYYSLRSDAILARTLASPAGVKLSEINGYVAEVSNQNGGPAQAGPALVTLRTGPRAARPSIYEALSPLGDPSVPQGGLMGALPKDPGGLEKK